MQRAIRDLHAMPNPAVYRRANGDLYAKLNAQFQVRVRIEEGAVIGDGTAEAIDPDELVEVVRDGAPNDRGGY